MLVCALLTATASVRADAAGSIDAASLAQGRPPSLCEAAAVSDFAGRGLDDWDMRSFSGETRYELVTTRDTGSDRDSVASNRVEPAAGSIVLQALAEGAASGLFRELAVDLRRTPLLHWSWWIESPVAVEDVRKRAGDDFAARVYVVFSGGLAFWRTTSLVYVWAENDAPAGFWPNPFTDNARMLAVTRGAADGTWQSVYRDVFADYRAAFGADPPPVAAVAIMTDTDQTGERALARYGDLWFESRPEQATEGSAARRCEPRVARGN